MNLPYSLSLITGLLIFSLIYFGSFIDNVFPLFTLKGFGYSLVGLGISEGTSESAILPYLLISDILSLYLSTDAAKDDSPTFSKA